MKKLIRNKWFLAGSLGFLFLLLTVFILLGWTARVDEGVIRSVYKWRGGHSSPKGGFYWINRILTEAGYVYVLVPASILALVLCKGDLKSIFLSFGTLAVWGINQAVKGIIGRERPDLIYHMMQEGSPSYPSGHAMSSCFFYFFLAHILWQRRGGRFIKTLSILSACMPIVIGFTRVCLSVHYPTDVLGGLFLGASFFLLALPIFERLREKGFDGIKALIEKKKRKKQEDKEE